MHISSLWGEYSEGSFGQEAREWIDFIADRGFSWWQVLPFCVTDAFHSPYKSFSSFSGNPMFIDLPTLCREGLLTREELAQARQRTPYVCEFERLDHERLTLLSRAAERFDDTAAMERFLAAHPQVEAFCRFMALRQANGGAMWNEWTISRPDPQALRLWQFTQYMFYTQWMALKKYANDRGVSILGDIPIYVDLNSSDVWANPGHFRLDERLRPTAVAGVPPDYFCADGQLWGNPLYDWDAMEADDFSFWRERIGYMGELFDGVRIDHFRAFSAYYRIPADAKTAREGTWVKGPGMKLLRALRASTDALLVAEDLGDIDEDVTTLVRESGCPGMRVLQFAFLGDPDSPHLPHNYENNCVAYTGTHDNNTLLGYVWEASAEERRRLFDYCGYGSDDIHACYTDIFRTMFESHAGLLILPVQDLLLYGSDTRLNRPGQCEGNWSYRLTRPQLDAVDRYPFLAWNRRYGRAPRESVRKPADDAKA